MSICIVTKMPVDTCIRTRKIIKCSVLIDSYLHHVYFHARDYFTERQSTLPFRGIYVMGMEHRHLFLVKKDLPRYYIHYKVRNRSFVKNLGHRDFRVFSTRRTPAWRNGLHHLKLRYFIYKMMYKTPTFAEPQQCNIPFSTGQLSAFII